MVSTNIIGRVWKAIINDYPNVPNTADTDDENESEEPWYKCRWVMVEARCRIPLNDSENWPNGCSAVCPARLANEKRAIEREYQNTERLYH